MIIIRNRDDARHNANLFRVNSLVLNMKNKDEMWKLSKDRRFPKARFSLLVEVFTGEEFSKLRCDDSYSFDDTVEWLYRYRDYFNVAVKEHLGYVKKINDGSISLKDILSLSRFNLLAIYLFVKKESISFRTSDGFVSVCSESEYVYRLNYPCGKTEILMYEPVLDFFESNKHVIVHETNVN